MISQNAINTTTTITTTITTSIFTKKGSSMLKSLVSSKKRTLSNRSNFSASGSQSMNSAQIPTSNDWNLRPYWNGQVTEWSQKLWLSIITDSATSPLTSFSTYSFSILQN